MAEKSSGRPRKSASRKKTVLPKAANVTSISQGALVQEGSKTTENGESAASATLVLEEIRIRAYELFEQRGRLDGFDQEDWARAEAEVLARFQKEKSA